MAKNETAIRDMLACLELDIDCTLIEKDAQHFEQMKQTFEFLGAI